MESELWASDDDDAPLVSLIVKAVDSDHAEHDRKILAARVAAPLPPTSSSPKEMLAALELSAPMVNVRDQKKRRLVSIKKACKRFKQHFKKAAKAALAASKKAAARAKSKAKAKAKAIAYLTKMKGKGRGKGRGVAAAAIASPITDPRKEEHQERLALTDRPQADEVVDEDRELIDFLAALEMLPNLTDASKAELAKLPQGCFPQVASTGKASYTLKALDGALTAEVQLGNKFFRPKKTPTLWTFENRCISWSGRCPFEAWREFCEKTKWPAP